MTFPTIYDKHERVHCSSGNTEHILYKGRYAKDGALELYEFGKENIPEKIQAGKDLCDLKKLIAKYQRGDQTALMQRNPADMLYGDFTQVPTSLIEWANFQENINQQFAELPTAVKAKFNNSLTEFMAAIDAGVVDVPELMPDVSKEPVPADPVPPVQNVQTPAVDPNVKVGENV